MAVGTVYEAIDGRNRVLSTYRQMSVETATPGELVLMLYNRALRSMKEAILCLEDHDISGSNSQIQRAQDIVSELRGSLNVKAGGELAAGLDAIYEYINKRLLEANIKKDPAPVADAAKILTEIRDGWREAVMRNTHGY